MKYFRNVLLAAIALSNMVNAQLPGNSENLEKGRNLIQEARAAIGFNSKDRPINTITLRVNSAFETGGIQIEKVNELTFAEPNLVRYEETSNYPTYSNFSTIWDGVTFKKTLEMEFAGKRTVNDLTKPQPPSSLFEQSLSKNDLEKAKRALSANPRLQFSDQLWTIIFPIILKQPMDQDVEFIYAGVTESGGIKAHVVDAKTQSGREIRLIFDNTSKYLLMMTVKYLWFDGDYEDKYYFSDRVKMSEIVVPTKIKLEHTFTPTGKQPIISYIYLDVKHFEANAVFKNNHFKTD